MTGYGILDRARKKKSDGQNKNMFDTITVGQVVDTNDPSQMGRIRVLCPMLGDVDNDVPTLPWALYMSPFGGSQENLSRGPDEESTSGPVAYGMWNIPKIGAQVLIACIDGDPNARVWMGCIYGQFSPNSLPHGRYTVQTGNNKPEGPLVNGEGTIEPLYSNMKTAFGTGNDNKEWRTRAADYSATAVDGAIVAGGQTISKIADDKDKSFDGTNYRQGYGLNNIDQNEESDITGKVYDSQTYSWTSPGFHAMSMDDRPENCRMRFRTTTGHQIILDDTNERIYISTAKGNNWVEMDLSGNIDIHSERRISIHAAKDINFSTDEAFRVHAKKGIHLYSGTEMRLHSVSDFHIRSDSNFRAHSKSTLYLQTDDEMNLKAAKDFKAETSKQLHLKSAKETFVTGKTIDWNGPTADSADPASEKHAFWTNRVPMHEPWGRIMMKDTDKSSGNAHVLELSYDSGSVGKKELSDTISRNSKWRR